MIENKIRIISMKSQILTVAALKKCLDCDKDGFGLAKGSEELEFTLREDVRKANRMLTEMLLHYHRSKGLSSPSKPFLSHGNNPTQFHQQQHTVKLFYPLDYCSPYIYLFLCTGRREAFILDWDRSGLSPMVSNKLASCFF